MNFKEQQSVSCSSAFVYIGACYGFFFFFNIIITQIKFEFSPRFLRCVCIWNFFSTVLVLLLNKMKFLEYKKALQLILNSIALNTKIKMKLFFYSTHFSVFEIWSKYCNWNSSFFYFIYRVSQKFMTHFEILKKKSNNCRTRPRFGLKNFSR